VVYSTVVSESETTVVLPATLSGTLNRNEKNR
jgi:hypothetical protein